jgi:hypothetical protein
MTGRTLLAAAVVVLAACGSGSSIGSGSETPTTTAAPATTAAPSTTSQGTAEPPAASIKPVTPIAPEPSVPLPGECTQSESSSSCPPDPERANELVGLTEEKAAADATANGWAFRVAVRDGEDLLLTQDYNASRVNVAVRAGIVERAWFG